MTTVILVRHGATDWNLAFRAQGHADIPLNDTGRQQARTAARHLGRRQIDAVYASDLRRVSDTARAIAAPHGLEVILEPALREIDQGEWTGLDDSEIRARWPGMWEERHRTARPGGESPEEVRRRAVAALRSIVTTRPDDTIVLVSHGVTIRGLIAEALGYSQDLSGRLRGLGNGGILTFDAHSRDGTLAFDGLQRLDRRTPANEDPNA